MVRIFLYAGVSGRDGTFETRLDFSGTLAGLLERLEEDGHEISPAGSGDSYTARADLAGASETGKETDPLSLLVIMINGRHIAHVGGLDAPVSDGDAVSIFPLVSGG